MEYIIDYIDPFSTTPMYANMAVPCKSRPPMITQRLTRPSGVPTYASPRALAC